ncbi:MAG TPA: glucose 1-dehydrogenase [Acidimicrobiales bacterium]|nr:glucose 1-dehydrogenase [Acidimicrobiales bacterium]
MSRRPREGPGEGPVAVVTGASLGIGRAVAGRLTSQGSRVVLCARSADALGRVADDLRRGGAEVEVVVADVTAAGSGDEIVGRAMDRFGRVDVLVNNAGGGPVKPFAELAIEDWQEGLDLNFLSAVRCCLAAVPHMAAGGGGAIVNLASSTAREPDPYFGPYGVAKAALVNYTKVLAGAVARQSIRANCVLPGIVDTEGSRQVAADTAASIGRPVDEVMAAMLRKAPIPLGRLGTPEDVAAVIAFLVSDEAAWVTGSTFSVDGGALRAAW